MEQDSWPDGLDDELASTEEALAAERDETDAAASEDLAQRIAPYEGADLRSDTISVQEQHEREQEELGFALAWWQEDFDIPPIDTVSDVANNACGLTQHLRAMEAKGYPEGAMSAEVVLDQKSGPLVIAGLQILGVLHPHLRDDIRSILVYLHDHRPVMTEEEEAAWREAHEAWHREQFEQAKAAFEAQGVPVISLDEAAELLGEDEADEGFSAGLN